MNNNTENPLLTQLKKLVREMVDHEYLYFDTAAIIETRQIDFPIWGLCVSPTDQLYVMDGESQWTPVAPEDEPYLYPILQKTKGMSARYLGEVKTTETAV